MNRMALASETDYDSHTILSHDFDFDTTSLELGTATIPLSSNETPRFRLDRRGRFVFVNRSAAQALHTQPDLAVGLPVTEIAEPVFGVGFKTKIMRALQKQRMIRFEHCCHAQPPIWLTVWCAPAAGLLDVFFIDITWWKTKEQYWAQLSADFLEARDETGRQVAHELHDVVAQDLVFALFDLERLQRKKGHATRDHTSTMIVELQTALEHCLAKVKALSFRLHPPLLDEAGIVAALRWYIRHFQDRTRMKVSLAVPHKIQPMQTRVAQTIFRAVEEALLYYAQHSRTRKAKIALNITRSKAVLEIMDVDQGLGGTNSDYLDEIAAYGFGFTEIWARAFCLRGSLRVTSSDNGTCLFLTLPLGRPPTGVAVTDSEQRGR